MTLSYDLTPDTLHDLGADLRTTRMFSQWLAARGRKSTRLTPDDLEDAANYGLRVHRIVWCLGLTTCFVDEDGARRWYSGGLLHRDDGPAIEGADGTRAWYKEGRLHRDDGPAIEGADGSRRWYSGGLLCREDGPAIERADGFRAWCYYGEYHRADGPAVEYADGRVEYWTHGRRIA